LNGTGKLPFNAAVGVLLELTFAPAGKAGDNNNKDSNNDACVGCSAVFVRQIETKIRYC
jgi:hypothetical protein